MKNFDFFFRDWKHNIFYKKHKENVMNQMNTLSSGENQQLKHLYSYVKR